MQRKDILAQLPQAAHHSFNHIYDALDSAEGMFGPDGKDYIQMMALLQCEIANRIFNATEHVKDKQ